MMREKFIPVQIDQDRCLHCERCYHACRNKAIYFEKSIRLVDYSKCKGCLTCVQVCPRNIIEVISVTPGEVVEMKIDRDKCSMCGMCTDPEKGFCPNNLFYIDKINKNGMEVEIVKFKRDQISKCQGCLKCELTCPEKAIKAVVYEG